MEDIKNRIWDPEYKKKYSGFCQKTKVLKKIL